MASTEHREVPAARRPALTGDGVAALSAQVGEGPALFARRRAAAERYAAAADRPFTHVAQRRQVVF